MRLQVTRFALLEPHGVTLPPLPAHWRRYAFGLAVLMPVLAAASAYSPQYAPMRRVFQRAAHAETYKVLADLREYLGIVIDDDMMIGRYGPNDVRPPFAANLHPGDQVLALSAQLWPGLLGGLPRYAEFGDSRASVRTPVQLQRLLEQTRASHDIGWLAVYRRQDRKTYCQAISLKGIPIDPATLGKFAAFTECVGGGIS